MGGKNLDVRGQHWLWETVSAEAISCSFHGGCLLTMPVSDLEWPGLVPPVEREGNFAFEPTKHIRNRARYNGGRLLRNLSTMTDSSSRPDWYVSQMARTREIKLAFDNRVSKEFAKADGEAKCAEAHEMAHTKSRRNTATDTIEPSHRSARSERCHWSQISIRHDTGSTGSLPRARHILFGWVSRRPRAGVDKKLTLVQARKGTATYAPAAEEAAVPPKSWGPRQ